MGALSFNEMEIDALGEMMNISLGASATAMSTLLDSRTSVSWLPGQISGKIWGRSQER